MLTLGAIVAGLGAWLCVGRRDAQTLMYLLQGWVDTVGTRTASQQAQDGDDLTVH
jgi:hypothetical protein